MMSAKDGRPVTDFDVFRLKKTPLFSGIEGLDKAKLQTLGARLETYAKGELICAQGDSFPYLAFLLSGVVEAGFSANTYYQMIERFKAGETFAEAVAFKGIPSPVEIRAMRESDVILIECEPLLNSPDDPVISRVLALVVQEMCNKMMLLVGKVRMLRNPVIVGRMAQMLLDQPCDDEGVVEIKLTQAELGEYTGSSRPRVSGALACLVEDSLIAPVEGRRGAYRILDRDGLVYTAGNGRLPGKDGEDSGAFEEGQSDARQTKPKGVDAAQDAGNAEVRIDSTQTMRRIVEGEPAFELFLQHKGFPFTVDNPITEIVTFDDVVQMQHLDKDGFLAEYAEWKKEQPCS